MNKESFNGLFVKLTGLDRPLPDGANFISLNEEATDADQAQTNEAFSDKWTAYEKSNEKERCYEFQKHWYLSLYGFSSEETLSTFLCDKKVIFDAGCGLGYKAAWFADLAPDSLVIGMDFSEIVRLAAQNYSHLSNLFFIRGDIAMTTFPDSSIDYVSCDQVIQHTQNPNKTFEEFTRITKKGGEIACYFYAKKALPRELIDDYFRTQCTNMTSDELWEMSAQLAELGRRLSELQISFDCPEIPALGIKGGVYDIQRFVYWNFLKCFWNEHLGRETSVMTNFDWYSPSNARRFSEEEIMALVTNNGLSIVHFHHEEACYSGRFIR
ncbi:MAG: class I SAM-dependent methyltransferase [Deltaproteobacteria bacterium]|nr:class I SAM-dependent methyltransferase [Deltaproteobacteria bacterium]